MPQPTHAQTPTLQISVINESTVLADADFVPVVAALQKQVSNDFRPVWGKDAALSIVPKGTQPPTGVYIGIFTVSTGSGWQQQTAGKRPTNVPHRGAVGTRRKRRSVPHELWINGLPQRKIAGDAQKYRLQLETLQKRREAA